MTSLDKAQHKHCCFKCLQFYVRYQNSIRLLGLTLSGWKSSNPCFMSQHLECMILEANRFYYPFFNLRTIQHCIKYVFWTAFLLLSFWFMMFIHNMKILIRGRVGIQTTIRYPRLINVFFKFINNYYLLERIDNFLNIKYSTAHTCFHVNNPKCCNWFYHNYRYYSGGL